MYQLRPGGKTPLFHAARNTSREYQPTQEHEKRQNIEKSEDYLSAYIAALRPIQRIAEIYLRSLKRLKEHPRLHTCLHTLNAKLQSKTRRTCKHPLKVQFVQSPACRHGGVVGQCQLPHAEDGMDGAVPRQHVQ